MNENKHPVVPFRVFLKRVLRNIILAFTLLILSLILGMAGYMHFEKMSIVDAYENAAMILSGMGPADAIKTTGGKIFAGSYALFSGIIFLVIMAIIIAPIVHRFFHQFFSKDN